MDLLYYWGILFLVKDNSMCCFIGFGIVFFIGFIVLLGDIIFGEDE